MVQKGLISKWLEKRTFNMQHNAFVMLASKLKLLFFTEQTYKYILTFNVC